MSIYKEKSFFFQELVTNSVNSSPMDKSKIYAFLLTSPTKVSTLITENDDNDPILSYSTV